MTIIVERDNSSHLAFPLLTKPLVAYLSLCSLMDIVIAVESSLGVMRIFERELSLCICLS